MIQCVLLLSKNEEKNKEREICATNIWMVLSLTKEIR